jgi:hypothetical protein
MRDDQEKFAGDDAWGELVMGIAGNAGGSIC